MVIGDEWKYQNEEADSKKKNRNKKLFRPKKGVKITYVSLFGMMLEPTSGAKQKRLLTQDEGEEGEGTRQLQKEVTDTDGGGKIKVGERDFTSNALKIPTFAYFLHGLGN